jgi:hypothetical protein
MPADPHDAGPQDADPQDFYIGWSDDTPPSVGRRIRLMVALIAVFAVGLAATLAASQAPFAASSFEFGEVRTFEGVVTSWPAPALSVARPGQTGPDGWSRYTLVQVGKHGAADRVADLDGHRVRLQGTLIYRGDQTMLELTQAPLEDQGPATMDATSEDLGRQALVGEIVDSKCFLGVMNPGNLKTHRSCAVRCIEGGIPPMLLVRDEAGGTRHVLLVGPKGEAINDRVLDRVAEPVRVRGRLQRENGQLVLRTDPSTIERM